MNRINPPLAWNDQRHNANMNIHNPTQLFMVSKKEKLRLQEEKERILKLQETEKALACAALKRQLLALLKAESHAQQVNRILSTAKHDHGLTLADMGMETRLLVLELFYRANQPSEMVKHLPEVVEEDQSKEPTEGKNDQDRRRFFLLDQFRLWAHASLKDWKSAVPYATRLYCDSNCYAAGDDNNQESRSPFSNPKMENLLQQFAIQAFANTNEYVDRAMELFDEAVSANNEFLLKTANVNLLLRCHLRNHALPAVQDLFLKILDIERQPQSKDAGDSFTYSMLDFESFEIALDCAAQTGNLEFMEVAIAYMPSFLSSLEAFILEKSVVMANNKAKGTVSRQRQAELIQKVLTAIAKAAASKSKKEVTISAEHQTLARLAMEALLSDSRQHTIIEPEILSQLLVAFDNESDVVATAQALCAKGRTQKGGPAWHSSLSVPAMVRILGPLFLAERVNSENYMSTNAWKILMRLVAQDKTTGTVSQKSRQFLREQTSHSFVQAALLLACFHPHGMEGTIAGAALPGGWHSRPAATEYIKSEIYQKQEKLRHAILQDCWRAIFFNQDGTGEERRKALAYNDACRWVLFTVPFLPDETDRIEVFIKIVKECREHLLSHSGFVVDSLELSPPSFGNKTLDLIVHETILCLQTAGPFADNNANEKEQQLIKKLATGVAIGAMKLVTGLEVFSPEYYWRYGTSDNGAKEALYMIMKELLVSNNLTDDEMIQPATTFYFSLAWVAQSSSVVTYSELLFPKSSESEVGQIRIDPYQVFRRCVVGSESGDTLATPGLSVADDLSLLLPSLVEMARGCDKRTGGSSHEEFVLAYQTFFLSWKREVFLDVERYYPLCDKIAERSTDSIFMDLWTSDLARMLINRLGSCREARYWIVGPLTGRSMGHKICGAATYLVDVYAKADVFYDILDSEDLKPLGDDYLRECSRNCYYLVKWLFTSYFPKTTNAAAGAVPRRRSGFGGQSGHKDDGPRRGLPKKSKSSNLDGMALLIPMLETISQWVEKRDRVGSVTPAGVSLNRFLTRDVLNSFCEYMPKDAETLSVFRSFMSGPRSDLHPEIEGPRKEWYEEFFCVEKENASEES